MNAIDFVLPRLRTEEGFRSLPYRDTVGKLTIGYGLNLDAGISKGLADVILDYLVRELDVQLAAYDWYAGCSDVRKSVLLDMAFNMGLPGLLHFTHTLAAIQSQDWTAAKTGLLNSLAARQLPMRYAALADILFTGAITGQ